MRCEVTSDTTHDVMISKENRPSGSLSRFFSAFRRELVPRISGSGQYLRKLFYPRSEFHLTNP